MRHALTDLIGFERQTISIRASERIAGALALMRQHDFGQLPVVDEAGNVLEPANHEALQGWAVEMPARFNEVFVPPALAALEATRDA